MLSGDSSSPWRLLPSGEAPGASHMALDQALLEEAVQEGFPPTLRFYRWSPPAISIGRFQPLAEVDLAACDREGIDVVRRPTGGKCILHLDDFTYSLVLPARFPLPNGVAAAYRLICGGILCALRRLGLPAVIQSRVGDHYRRGTGACFAATTQADLAYAGRKICGSAQVRRRGAVLQHGSILMQDRSELLFRLLSFEGDEQRKRALAGYRERCIPLSEAGCRCGWEEVAASFRAGFQESFGVKIEPGGLSPREGERWRALVRAYESIPWLVNAQARVLPTDAGA